MKIIKYSTLLMFCLSLVATAEATERYSVDEQAVDELFASSEQMDNMDEAVGGFNTLAMQDANHGKQPAVAFALAWTLGYLGIHRFYLGTSTGVGLGYIFTLGGCGIVATVDWIMLLIEVIEVQNFDNYVDNNSFFMWTGN